MPRRSNERKLNDVRTRLVRARDELAVIDEQLATLREAADEARIRSLVSETPVAEREWQQASRHADAMAKSRTSARLRIEELERTEHELLARLTV
jgi:hypothetical protein